MHHHTQGYTRVIPAGAFRATAKASDIFVMCAANAMSDELRVRFGAECCVEITKVPTLCARIEDKLPTGSTFIAKRISYYSKDDEIGIRWAFPDKIAFEKTNDYTWQNEFRFAFSVTDALQFKNTSQQIEIPARGSITLPEPIVTAHETHNILTRSLQDICRLHVF